MLVKIREGTWCMFYNQYGSNSHFVSGECYGILIDETTNERNQTMCTVLMGDELFEIPKEEVHQC